jgi:hypothetical protein
MCRFCKLVQTDVSISQRLVLLEANEKEVASCLMMANDATEMMAYLSTDLAFVSAFTVPSLRSRLVDMLGSILGKLGSKKSSDFKIDGRFVVGIYTVMSFGIILFLPLQIMYLIQPVVTFCLHTFC